MGCRPCAASNTEIGIGQLVIVSIERNELSSVIVKAKAACSRGMASGKKKATRQQNKTKQAIFALCKRGLKGPIEIH